MFAVVLEQNDVRLDVSMDDKVVMKELESLGHVESDLFGSSFTHRVAMPGLLDVLDEVVSRQMTSYDVLFALYFKRLYELFDVWVIAEL